jgi:hypothetical protein
MVYKYIYIYACTLQRRINTQNTHKVLNASPIDEGGPRATDRVGLLHECASKRDVEDLSAMLGVPPGADDACV